MTKVSVEKWSQLDFLINNFFEIVEYKRGRGIYGDRVILKRPRNAIAVFGEPEKLSDFFYMDANAVKTLPLETKLNIKNITRMVTSPECMNELCEFKTDTVDPVEWAMETKKLFENSTTLDYGELNKILINQYKKLDGEFLNKLKKHREQQYFLAKSENYSFITSEYAEEQLNLI